MQDFATGGGGLWQRGGARCMLNYLWCAVGPLHSQKIFNFGVSWGGGLPPGSVTGVLHQSLPHLLAEVAKMASHIKFCWFFLKRMW